MRTIRAREVFQHAGLKLVALEVVDLRPVATERGGRLHGAVMPLALVVYDRDGTYALNMKAERVELDRLKQEHPGLDSLI